ncbi:hypothetical protein BDZ89DRAFT_1041890 [Hymenopellis radicata]|nr:hypothetical protein BDZ89DRAFT_1041890 [Hymenopellis radicata]
MSFTVGRFRVTPAPINAIANTQRTPPTHPALFQKQPIYQHSLLLPFLLLPALFAVLALTPELTELKLKWEWSQSGGYDVVLEELWALLTFTNHSQLVLKLTTFIIHADSTSTYDMKRTIDFIGDDLCDCLDSRYRDDNKAAQLQNVEILFRFDADGRH